MILLRESISSNLLLKEAAGPTGGDKFTYMEGIFAQAELKNRNGRIYPIDVMKESIDLYKKEYVLKNRAIGEISHPESRPDAKPELASHLVTELFLDGNNVIGKARIVDTPQGNILKGLMKSGVQMGVSTRGLGSVTESGGDSLVDKGYIITAIDAVVDPSGIDCFVDAINESREWVISGDGRILEMSKSKLKSRNSVKRMTESEKASILMNFIKSL